MKTHQFLVFFYSIFIRSNGPTNSLPIGQRKWEDAIFETEQKSLQSIFLKKKKKKKLETQLLDFKCPKFGILSKIRNACQWKTVENWFSVLSCMLYRGEGVLASTAGITVPLCPPYLPHYPLYIPKIFNS